MLNGGEILSEIFPFIHREDSTYHTYITLVVAGSTRRDRSDNPPHHKLCPIPWHSWLLHGNTILLII